MKRIILKTIWHVTVICMVAVTSCSKDIALGTDPYAGGKGSLGIGFYADYAEPGIAKPGELVDFYVKGIKPYLGNIDFSINDTKVEVVAAKDSLVTIRVPAEISSGNAKIIVDGQVFYGPRLEIEGDASLDDNYGMVNGFSSTVYDIFPNAGGFIVTGAFYDFENESVDKKVFRNGIHFIGTDGKTSTSMNNFGKRSGGVINSIAKMTDGKFMIGGGFGTYNNRSVSSITRLNTDGSLDSMVVEVINTTGNPKNSFDTVSTFNGGLLGGSAIKVFGVADNKVLAIGNFLAHYKIDYTYSSKSNRRYIFSDAKHVIRMKADGSLDSAFALKNEGANGRITSAALIDNDRVLVIGSFTTYNGKSAPGIVCIKSDGSVDPSFNLKGTIDRIISINYNAQLKKIAIAGVFKGLGASGKVNGVAIISTDGSVDEEFILQDIGTGIPVYAQVLNNGRVVVNGTIETYNNIRRSNMLILEKDGSLLQRYNSQAPFAGVINKIVETKSSLGLPALLIGGSIYQYGKKNIGNFFRLEIKD